MFEKVQLFYFTGTGNAFATTNWIAKVSEEHGLPVEIKKISPSTTINPSEIGQNSLIGFCYPTHGFNAPPVVLNFLARFPKGKSKVLLLNTRAGMKLHKLFLPGLSGLAQLLPAIILRLKGYKIVGYQPMDLPSNWIPLHPGLRKKVVASIFERCQRITKQSATKILQGKRIYKAFLSLPFDLLVSPVSVGYYFVGRFALSKTYVASYRCNGCNKCVKECPVNAIVLKNNRPFWQYKCESCMHCLNNCPQRAIETPHLFTVLIWWLIFSIIPLWIIGYLTSEYPLIQKYVDLLELILMIAVLPILFFSYRILHFLMQFRLFNWLITYTSLTKLKFWRRYRAPKEY